MSTDEFHRRLDALFPEFDATLADSLHARDDGSFTPHGLCAEFSYFYVERIGDFASPQVAELFRLIETIVAADPHDRDPLANAVCTCFLENISCTGAGEAGRALMGPASLRFFEGWHRPPPYDR